MGTIKVVLNTDFLNIFFCMPLKLHKDICASGATRVLEMEVILWYFITVQTYNRMSDCNEI